MQTHSQWKWGRQGQDQADGDGDEKGDGGLGQSQGGGGRGKGQNGGGRGSRQRSKSQRNKGKGNVIKEKVACEKAKGKMRKARVRAKPGAGARAAPRGIRVAKEKIRVTQRGLKQGQNLEAPVGRPSRKWKKKWLQSSMSSTCRSWKSSGSRPCKVSCRPQGNKNCSKPSNFFLADSIADGLLPEAWDTAFSSAKQS